MFCRSIFHIRRRGSSRPTAHGSGTSLCDNRPIARHRAVEAGVRRSRQAELRNFSTAYCIAPAKFLDGIVFSIAATISYMASRSRSSEVESSKRNDRPQLAAAMVPGQEAQGHLAGGQAHRRSRSVAFISTLMESKGFDFAIADMPGANRLTLHVLAAAAEPRAPHDRRAHTPCAGRRQGPPQNRPPTKSRLHSGTPKT